MRSSRFVRCDFANPSCSICVACASSRATSSTFSGLFQLNTKYITVKPSPLRNGEIDIVIRGPWLHTILFEIPVLAIVNEVYFRALQKAR